MRWLRHILPVPGTQATPGRERYSTMWFVGHVWSLSAWWGYVCNLWIHWDKPPRPSAHHQCSNQNLRMISLIPNLWLPPTTKTVRSAVFKKPARFLYATSTAKFWKHDFSNNTSESAFWAISIFRFCTFFQFFLLLNNLSKKRFSGRLQIRRIIDAWVLMKIASITWNSSLIPFINGIYSSYPSKFEFSLLCSHILLVVSGRKNMMKEKSNHSKISSRLPTWIYKWVLCRHIHIHVCRIFGPFKFFGPCRWLDLNLGLTLSTLHAVGVRVCIHTPIHPHTLPSPSKIRENTNNTSILLMSK